MWILVTCGFWVLVGSLWHSSPTWCLILLLLSTRADASINRALALANGDGEDWL